MTKISLNCYRTIFRYANILGTNFLRNSLHNLTRYIYMWRLGRLIDRVLRAYQRRGKSSNSFKVLMVPDGPWRGLLLPASRVQSGKCWGTGASPAAIAA